MLHVSRKIIMPKAKKIFGNKTTDSVCQDAFLLQVEGDGKKLSRVVCSLYNEKQQLYRNTVFT